MKVLSLFFILKSTSIIIPYKDEYDVYQKGDLVILKTDEFAEEIGRVQKLNFALRKSSKIDLSGEILRKITERDLQKQTVNQDKEDFIKTEFYRQIEVLELDMHLVSAHYSLDNSLIYLTFLSESRVDFRELVKNIAKKFQKKIHLQQIGPRDRSTLNGGFGLCGREFCCRNFLDELPSVTMETVRVQNMAYKCPDKLSGQCGKLMCCLNYEVVQYRELSENFPKFGAEISCKKRKGTVIGIDVLNEKVKIKFEDQKIETIPLNELVKG